MKVTKNWISDWVNLDGVDFQSVVERLSLSGLEVAGVRAISDEKIVVGQIETIEAHPKSDKLVICQVCVGDGRNRQIGCGAKNMKVGDKVPVALDGARPPGLDIEIGSRPLAGIMSEGMLCAEEELGLESSSDGLWILSQDLPLGMPVLKATKLEDIVVEIELTPNRPDGLSHRGVAREIASIVGRPIRTTPVYEQEVPSSNQKLSVSVEDTTGCPVYLLSELSGVVVGPSPDWLRRRLALIGVRSINNVVDVTNYILMDLAQPLHAFDADKVQGSVVVRRAKEGEVLEGIDHKVHNLQPGDLVIADDSGPIAIAGVMGGVSTEVTEVTTRVLLECAYFDPSTVRKTARRLGLHTESSHRFERGIDVGATEAHLRAAESLLGAVQSTPVQCQGRAILRARSAEPKTVLLPSDMVSKVLGLELSQDRVTSVLESIGLTCEAVADGIRVTVPTWRPDIERPIDLVEEVIRLHGYEHLTPKAPMVTMGYRHHLREGGSAPTIRTGRRLLHERRIRTLLLGMGFVETLGYSFCERELLDLVSTDAGDPRSSRDELANALSPDLAVMRTSLLPTMLKTLKVNIAQRVEDIAFFEVGRSYLSSGERNTLGILVMGRMTPHHSHPRNWDVFDLKGLVEGLAQPLAHGAKWVVPSGLESAFHPGVQAHWIQGDRVIGRVGQVHPQVASRFDADQPVFVAEIDLDSLLGVSDRASRYHVVSKFPSVRRDFALIYPKERPFSDLKTAVEGLGKQDGAFGKVFQRMHLFDVYEGAQVPDGMRSLAFSVTYQSFEHTLTDPEIQSADTALIEHLRGVGLELRH